MICMLYPNKPERVIYKCKYREKRAQRVHTFPKYIYYDIPARDNKPKSN